MSFNSSMNTNTQSAPDLAGILADALKQQASQFEAIVNGLQTQISNMQVQSPPSKSEKKTKKTVTSTEKKNPSGSGKKAKQTSKETPKSNRARPANPYFTPPAQTPSKPLSTPKQTPNATTPPSRKRAPLQMLLEDTPKDFKQMKDALYVHVKTMWGMFKPDDVPPPPDESLLKEFYSRFSDEKAIDACIENAASPDIIAQNDILTLRSASASGEKIGRSMGRLEESHILYVHAVLAKVGIRVWGPDLCAAHDSLYNSACRLTALATFRQLCGAGAYDGMNVNSLSLMVPTYNHYVHFVMANKFKTEMKELGKTRLLSERKGAQKNRERLRDARVDFLLRNRNKIPPRYIKMAENVLAHSDDEDIPGENASAIKTLPYRGKNASKFWWRVDIERIKEAQISGKTIRGRVRKLPKKPIMSTFTKAPTNFPLDFYDADWFNNLQPGQKRLVANVSQVVFLPDASKSLLPVRHPDEKLGDRAFNAKYFDIISEPYVLDFTDDEMEDNSEDESGESLGSRDTMDEDKSQHEDEEDDSDYYAEGDMGDLYDEDVKKDDDDEEGVVGKGKGKAVDVSSDEEESEGMED